MGDTGLVLDKLGVFPRIKAGIESICVQVHISCETFQVVLAKSTLVLTALVCKEIVVKIPIGILVTGTLCSLS